MIYMDMQIVLEREAWYKAGAGAVAMYSGVGALVISAVAGLIGAIWHVGTIPAVLTTALVCIAWIAAANGIVILQARQVARRGEVSVDRY
jgi:hypothetical protein